ncbi:MAG: dockerin type I domain-containing protein, partial [Verrucomicrobiota bacterium]|nr:dockerin type I domain-containing protein [Verrucomicrobiota bacterium]
VDAIGANRYVYEVDHELASEVVRLSSSVNDAPWVTQSVFTDPELATTVPNTNPGPTFANKQTHRVYGVFNASIPTTNAANPPFGKLLNIWDFVAEAPAVAGGPPGPFANYPIFKGVIDSPTTPAPPAGSTTYGTTNANIFPAGDIDSAGNIYVAWSMNNARTNEFSVWFASSHDGGKTFYGPFPVSSGSLNADETAVLPWVAAGDGGRVNIVWYKTDTVGDPNTLPKPPAPNPALWNVFFAQSLNADSREPVFTTVKAGDHVMHKGQISTGGLIGSSDRSLLDYFEINNGPDGLANIIYADNGASAIHAEFLRQVGGSVVLTAPTFPTCLDVAGVQLADVVSRKTHGPSGPFDIHLPLTGSPGIECRSGQPNSGDHTLVFTFANVLTSVGGASSSQGTAAGMMGPDPRQYTVTLTGVNDIQTITVTLTNVNDGTNVGNVSVQMSLLLGDVNGSKRVDGSDLTSVRQQSLKPVTSANFREDVNASGRIDGRDGTVVAPAAQALHTLP